MASFVSLERPMAFRKSFGVLIASVGGGILSGSRRDTKFVVKERRKRGIIDSGRVFQHARKLCILSRMMEADNGE